MFIEGHEAYQQAMYQSKTELQQMLVYDDMGWFFELLGDLDQAENYYRRATEIKKQKAPKSLLLSLTIQLQGLLAWKRGDLTKAEQFFHQALVIREVNAPNSLTLTTTYNNLGLMAWERGELAEAKRYHHQALTIRKAKAPNSLKLAATFVNIGLVVERQGDLVEAENLYHQALVIQKAKAPNSLRLATTYANLGVVARKRGDLAEAERRQLLALVIREAKAPNSLKLAATYSNLGVVARRRGDLAEAERRYHQALVIQKAKAPNSLRLATTYANLGVVARRRGDLAEAERRHLQALVIREAKAPNSLSLASAYALLGIVSRERGNLAEAERWHRQALGIRESKAPTSLDLANTFNSLGVVTLSRGSLEESERFFLKALAIQEAKAPNSISLAKTLNNLGFLASKRGDRVEAERRYLQALDIRESKASNSLDLADTFSHLGVLAWKRGALMEAERRYHQAKVIQESKAPNSLALANIFNNLGVVAFDRGDLEEAERRHLQALVIRKAKAPNSLALAATFSNLGVVAWEREDLVEAERRHLQALAIRKTKAPNSLVLAYTHNNLARTYKAILKPTQAQFYFEQSLKTLESQIRFLGGSQETKVGFVSQQEEFYDSTIEFFLEQNRPEQAFYILERSRTKILLDMMAERDQILIGEKIPQELDRKRQRLAHEYEQTQAAIEPEADKVEILRDLRRQYEEIKRQIRVQSPRLASIRYPQALDLKAVQDALDPETVLLSYCVLEGKSYLFVVEKNTEVKGFTISKGTQDFQEMIKSWRQQATDPKIGDVGQKIFSQSGSELFHLLIEPVRTEIENAKRLVIIPDGPLHMLPFHALVERFNNEKPCYMIEWKPVTTIVSATVFAELKQDVLEKMPLDLLAFANPIYPKMRSSWLETLSQGYDALLNKLDLPLRAFVDELTPLPGTLAEVNAISALYQGKSKILLGEDATEENAKSTAFLSQYLHFATHARYDAKNPLNSAVILTIPEQFIEGKENGMLQAWEIFEGVRLNCDLLVLSACQTGIGKEMGGEGLIGLTRAFQFAGARSIVASSWNVQDQATAVLMETFYRNLKVGMNKAEALRQAQIALIRKPITIKRRFLPDKKIDASHPYYWAAFQLIGPWD